MENIDETMIKYKIIIENYPKYIKMIKKIISEFK
jgi:hypothetical protein